MSKSPKPSKTSATSIVRGVPDDSSIPMEPAPTLDTQAIGIPTNTNLGTVNALRGGGRGREAMNELEKSMGGRDGVVDALIMADLSPKQQHFLGLLLDPARVQDSLATICADAAVTPHELLDLFRSSTFAKAHTMTLSYIASKAIDVAKDVVEKAVDTIIPCPTCHATGIKDGKPCSRCNGTKQTIRESDVDRQKMIFEASGILKKGGGVNVNVQQNTAIASGPSMFSKFVKASDDTAYDVTLPPIDAEVSDV